jgi:hypothetical protein
MDDVAKAWPINPSDYRFLQKNDRYDAEREAQRKAVVHEDDDDRFHTLSTLADDQLEERGNGFHEFPVDRTMQHMLFAASTSEEVDTLFRDQLADVVAEGAQRRQVARDGAFVFMADSNKGDVTVADDRQYTYNSSKGGTGEGGIIERDREGYSTVAWDCKKVDAAAEVTDEMVRHAQVDLIERQITHVGETVENNINRVWINELIDNANQSHTASASDERGIENLNRSVEQIDDNDFEADTFASGSAFRGELFEDSNLVQVNQSGRDAELRDRELDRVMGIEHLPASQAAYDRGSETFGYSSTGDVGAVVYQRNHIWLVMEHDTEIKDYDDPIRDLQGVNARAWVDATFAQTDAACQVKHD